MAAGPLAPSARVRASLSRIDWSGVAQELRDWGHVRLPGLLAAADCRALAALWPQQGRFRSHVDMQRHAFGAGAYRYFGHPLPPLVGALRTQLYARLAPIANAWEEALASGRTHPPRLREFLAHCHAAGQERPTPLLLRYGEGGYNCLHQDRYGGVAFPLQVAILLSRPQRDFRGGEFLLTEQRPRMQSRGFAIALERGEAVVFANAERPVRGARGHYRVRTRHGVSRVLSGERMTLGLIFHDAR